jgi:hypothetical protein
MVAHLDKSPLPSKTALRARGATSASELRRAIGVKSCNRIELGRFTYDARRRLGLCSNERNGSKDPMGAKAGSLCKYIYVRSDPLNLRDPSGWKEIGYFLDGAGQLFDKYGPTILYWLYPEYGTVGDVSIYQELPLKIVGDPRSFEIVVANAHKRICEEFCMEAEKVDCCSNTPPPPFNIDLFGWSRGAIAAMTIAKRLNTEGCKCKLVGYGFGKLPITHTAQIKPIDIRFLGVLDPVTLGLGLADYVTEVSPNVKSVFWAVADGRSFFTLGQVLPPPGLQIVKHYKITHDQIGFTGVLTVDTDLKSAAEASGVKFKVP